MKNAIPAPVEAVTFDAAGTLFRPAESVGHTYSRTGLKYGISSSPETIDAAFRHVFRQERSPYAECSSGSRADDGDRIEKRWWRRVVGKTFAEAASNDEISDPILHLLFEDLWDHFSRGAAWKPVGGAGELLEYLSGRLSIGVISNFDHRFHAIARDLGFLPFFDSVTLSSDVSAWKPDPAIFRLAAENLGCPPRKILHVGDDPACDWEGARRAGFQVFEFQSGVHSPDALHPFLG